MQLAFKMNMSLQMLQSSYRENRHYEHPYACIPIPFLGVTDLFKLYLAPAEPEPAAGGQGPPKQGQNQQSQ